MKNRFILAALCVIPLVSMLSGCSGEGNDGVCDGISVFSGCQTVNESDSAPLAYTISSLSPTPILVGDTLTITGSNFNAESDHHVYLYQRSTSLIEPLTVNSFADTRITAVISRALLPGSYEVYVGSYILAGDASWRGYPITLHPAELVNPGNLEGLVKDALTDSPLSGASVKVSQQGVQVGQTTTSSDGQYGFALSEGRYILEISLSGYLPATINVDVTHNETTTVTSLRQVPNTGSGNGVATGAIRNAFNGEGVSGVTLNIRQGVNTRTGAIIYTMTTDSNGKYSVTLPGGNYTIEAVKNGYISVYFTIFVVGDRTEDEQNEAITPILNPGEIQVVLTWGELPLDLDSHIRTPSIGGDTDHIYWDSLGSETFAPYVDLDVDDRYSYGPETVTIYKAQSGTYHYYVHNFSKSQNASAPAITTSDAKVKVFSSRGEEKIYNIPNSGEGLYWDVFTWEYNGNSGVITTINRITSEEPKGSDD